MKNTKTDYKGKEETEGSPLGAVLKLRMELIEITKGDVTDTAVHIDSGVLKGSCASGVFLDTVPYEELLSICKSDADICGLDKTLGRILSKFINDLRIKEREKN